MAGALISNTGVISLLERSALTVPIASALRYVREPRQARHRWALAADYRRFKRRFGFLAEGAHLAGHSQKALVVNLSDVVVEVKTEAMMAKALQVHGYTPVILTNRSCEIAVRYFRAFGYDQFVFFDELCQGVQPKVAEEARSLLAQKPDFQALIGLKYRNVYVGRHVLSLIVRRLRHGSVEFDDPQVKELLARLLPQSLQATSAAEALMADVKPAIALFGEKGYTPFGELFDVAVNQGINTIQGGYTYRPDALSLKRYTSENRTVHPLSLSSRSWQKVCQMPWTPQREAELMAELKQRYEAGTWFKQRLHMDKMLKKRDEVQEQLGLDPSRKTAVIFSHVLWDATFFYGENLFDDYEQWLVETVRVACSNRAVNWVVKVHPDYVLKMKQAGDNSRPRDIPALNAKIGQLPEHIKIMEPETDISTFSLFDVADYCLTVRGTIGIEMPCFGVPVFTAGTGRYSGLGFTIDSSSRQGYLAKVARIQDFPRLTSEQTSLARKHAYSLFLLRPCPMTTFEMVQMGLADLGHPLDHNLVIRAGSFRDIIDAADINAFATWAANSSEEDFLAPAPGEAPSFEVSDELR